MRKVIEILAIGLLSINAVLAETQSNTNIYTEISKDEQNFILKNQEKIKNFTQIYNQDEDFLIAFISPNHGISLLDFLAASHCAKYKKFAYRFNDSDKTRIWKTFPSLTKPLEAYYYECSENVVLRYSLTNSQVRWTNYDDKSFYKYPDKHLFLYRKRTQIFNKILTDANKKGCTKV